MVDTPGNTSTTRTIAVGGTLTDNLETPGDHDWFRISLTAGQELSISVVGLGLADPIVRLLDANGNVLFTDDDAGDGLNSLLSFRVPTTGTYYIDVSSAPGNQTGDYQVSVQPYVLPPLGTLDQFADQMTSGYWSGDSHHFDVTQGGTITVNLTALTDAGRDVARQALQLWSDIIGVNFAEVASGGQIVFDDVEDGTGAFSTAQWANGITTSATVNVSLSRLGLHTYLHEIAHALGLGHAGDYNGGTAFSRFPYEARYLNDGAAISLMSYFDNGESSYYSGLGFSNVALVTPQLADIIAIGNLYGLSTTTRTGDTIYGFNTNSGRSVYNAAVNASVSYTIFDNGGNDTLDYSGFGANQRIDLNPEAFSNIGGRVGNVSIARGTVIENAIGGSGNDIIIGNGVGNVLRGGAGADNLSGGAGSDTLIGGTGVDILTGGPGADFFRGAAAELNGDTILDWTVQDRIVISDANPAAFIFALNGNILTFTGGSLSVPGIAIGQIIARAAAGGGVELVLGNGGVTGDFGGDAYGDILWRNSAGAIGVWTGSASGRLTADNGSIVAVPIDWHVTGTGDFNGDGRTDILWRHSNGLVGDWLGSGSGSFVINNGSLVGVSNDWQVVGIGDFNGDARDDILWRQQGGSLGNWLGTESGNFVINNGSLVGVSTDWRVAGVGDFDGDGRDDILWRHISGTVGTWSAIDGGFSPNGSLVVGVSLNWAIIGTGDFNGDGRDDILWRNSDGTIASWLGLASRGFHINDTSLIALSNDWQVAAIGDFNGDGRDDLVLRSSSGGFTDWLGTASGGFVANDANAAALVSLDWNVQSPDPLWH